MVHANVVFDIITGKAYNASGNELRHRWLTYPHELAPESAKKLLRAVGGILLDFWGEGSYQMVLGEDGYGITAEKGDGRTFASNLGVLAVFENQHGAEGLKQEIHRRLQQPMNAAPAKATK